MAVKTKKKKNSSLSKRAKISHQTKDQGSSGSRVINWKHIEGDIQFFQSAEGKNAINIIPFEIKSKNHPLVKQGQMEIGEFDYALDVWVHRSIGPSESSVLCLKKTFGKACPICEEADKLKKQGKEKEASALYAKRRVFYNVEDIRKKPGVLQVFEVSHFLFEKELIDEARNDEDDSFIDFADPEIGSIVKFRCSKASQGGFEFNEFKSFSFDKREEAIDEDLLSSAISFDEYMNILSYDEVQAILFGADEDEEENDDDEKPSRKKKTATKKMVEEDDSDEEDSEDDEDNDEEDEKPVKKLEKKSAVVKGKKKPAMDDEEENEDEEDEDDDEKPVKKASAKSSKTSVLKCPNGFTFGKNADDHEECEDCEIWAKCIGAKK